MRKDAGLRNAHLARFAVIQARRSDDFQAQICQACELYWQKFRRKAFCFEDLKAPLAALDDSQRQITLDHITHDFGSVTDGSEQKLVDAATSINMLKLRYCFVAKCQDVSVSLGQIACDAIELYRRSLQTAPACFEAAILGAVALTKMAHNLPASRERCLLQAVLILKACRNRNEDYYPYLPCLLKLESALGLMSLAMKDFKRLSLKNIQWETAGHLILTRISTTHPQASGVSTPSSDAGLDPVKAIRAGVQMWDSAGETLSAQVRSGLKNGSYVNVLETLDLRSELERSLSRQLFLREDSRTRRLLDLPDMDGIATIPGEFFRSESLNPIEC